MVRRGAFCDAQGVGCFRKFLRRKRCNLWIVPGFIDGAARLIQCNVVFGNRGAGRKQHSEGDKDDHSGVSLGFLICSTVVLAVDFFDQYVRRIL